MVLNIFRNIGLSGFSEKKSRLGIFFIYLVLVDAILTAKETKDFVMAKVIQKLAKLIVN